MRATDLVLTTNLCKESAEGILALISYPWQVKAVYQKIVLPRVLDQIDAVPQEVVDIRVELDPKRRPILTIARGGKHRVKVWIPGASLEEMAALRLDFIGPKDSLRPFKDDIADNQDEGPI
ncbi:MAG: hypothetical protein JXR75_12380 [Rhodobacteraceae bacterium]|nr:hypothetical protein [Paracoccaceae bacterium]